MPPQKLTLELIKKEKASLLDAYSFYFKSGVFFDYLPGQYLRMSFDGLVDPRGNGRFFTISSSPTEKEHIMITTRIGPSPFKQYLSQLEIGTRVQVSAPFGNFIFDPEDTRPHVFIAGGIGLIPFRSMMRYAADKAINTQLFLFVSYSHPEEIVFHEELSEIVRTNPSYTYVPTITKPNETKRAWSGEVGRLEEVKFRKYIKNTTNCIYYICGPAAMVEALKKTVLGMGVEEEYVRIENFPGY